MISIAMALNIGVMKLSEYVDGARGRQTALAIALGCQSQLVWQWSRNVRRVPAEKCPAIERATSGAVRCEDLRPDVAWDVLRMQAAAAPAEEKAA
ncbi:DNA-binding transcriptional regulator YdaS (Cro superfamily) [Variovorax boronicumulans]|uniref:DNA-binding transcriptional regulator YdaS (Cro superfamily) n=1 Tax=Variovorax boronicumulans TaxID=436515 RepID=A0AAW8CRZ5_9BURK|nr:helix-turn-helix domain-containing protein [Variovorax boronicumulans]MDP9893214.1 DNA-binding transcriptional regulator YdaS (Cro superfamily) [Variovorax boronicumulans]MDQ0052439.1 DNA-binding transcriptional regulator YdaS (Cro superfamily) [Variovorax boronicumulans]